MMRPHIDYDDEADVLYVSFERPQRATDSMLHDNNVLLRYRGKKLVRDDYRHQDGAHQRKCSQVIWDG